MVVYRSIALLVGEKNFPKALRQGLYVISFEVQELRLVLAPVLAIRDGEGSAAPATPLAEPVNVVYYFHCGFHSEKPWKPDYL